MTLKSDFLRSDEAVDGESNYKMQFSFPVEIEAKEKIHCGNFIIGLSKLFIRNNLLINFQSAIH